MSENLEKPTDQVFDEAPASVAQTTPRSIGYGHPEYQFVQSIMEMQKSLGEINASILALTKTVDSTKSKVDELVTWKNMVFGGAITLGFLITIVIAVIKLFDHNPTLVQTIQSQPSTHQIPQQNQKLP